MNHQSKIGNLVLGISASLRSEKKIDFNLLDELYEELILIKSDIQAEKKISSYIMIQLLFLFGQFLIESNYCNSNSKNSKEEILGTGWELYEKIFNVLNSPEFKM